MGCDIHCYIESAEPGEDPSYWYPFGGRINPGRDYLMFSFLADVRIYGAEKLAVVEPRGLPDRTGYAVNTDAWCWVSDEDPDGEGNCSTAQAERWVANGSSVWREGGRSVSNPDWHNHSWLTPAEWAQAIAKHREIGQFPARPAYHAIAAALNALEKSGQQARVIFWFDN